MPPDHQPTSLSSTVVVSTSVACSLLHESYPRPITGASSPMISNGHCSLRLLKSPRNSPATAWSASPSPPAHPTDRPRNHPPRNFRDNPHRFRSSCFLVAVKSLSCSLLLLLFPSSPSHFLSRGPFCCSACCVSPSSFCRTFLHGRIFGVFKPKPGDSAVVKMKQCSIQPSVIM
jgi:hypothetical protein